MAAGEAEDALRQQILERVPDFPRLPIIDEAAGEAIDQSVARVRGFEQDRAAIRARVLLIKRRDEGFVKEIREENSLWYRLCVQRNASVVRKNCVATAFYHAEAFVFVLIHRRS
jgi:hypothetical protein